MNNAGLKRYKQELEATKRKGKTATRDLTDTPIDINMPTDFYDFIQKLGADKYIGKGREWRPGTIGNLWNNYTKNGKINSPKGDALREAVQAVLTSEFQTIDEITEKVEGEEVTKAKVTARLTQLVKAEIAEKTDVKNEETGKTVKAYKLV